MDVLHETEVTPDQIDHLGHMNVRYYGQHARAGADRLLAEIGLRPDEGRAIRQIDTYTRHHHEQLEGAPLQVRGGVLDVADARVRLYEELVNAETGAVAATFVLTFELVDRASQASTLLDPAIVDAASARTVPLPEHGQPRSIAVDDDVVARAPTLEVVRERRLTLRQPRVIDDALGGTDGLVSPLAIPELMWGGEAVPGREFRPVEAMPDGGQMGFATMETRATWARLPRVGDRVQSFGAELSIESKTMLTRNWLFDVDRGDVVAVLTIVSLAFDMGARRSLVIPDRLREGLTRRLHADLA